MPAVSKNAAQATVVTTLTECLKEGKKERNIQPLKKTQTKGSYNRLGAREHAQTEPFCQCAHCLTSL